MEKAYRRLGYVQSEQAGSEIAKRVIVAPNSSGDWFSIYDSGNADIDSGELKQVAVEFTRKFGAAALLTSVYDSDSFEFVMFHAGKQVDAAVEIPRATPAALEC